MKVLVVAIPQAGHLNPMSPMISRLVDDGDSVLVASGEAVRDQVTALGAGFTSAGAGMEAWFATLADRTRGAPGDGLPPDRIAHYFVPRLFGEIMAADMVDPALAAGERFEPDLVAYDAGCFAGPLVANLLGVAGVHHLFGPAMDPEVLQLAMDALSPLWRSFGRDVTPYAGMYDGLTVAICPPSMEPRPLPTSDVTHLRPAPLPGEPPQRGERPLVYVTFGTLWGEPQLLRQVLAALAAEPVDVVVTLGSLNPEQVGTVPANVRLERFIPQGTLLPHCSAVVHHAGAGTMFGALAHGLPQLALPQAADNFINAGLLERAGAAAVLLPGQVTVESVTAAVRRVLTDPGLREAARRIAAELAAMPGPEQLVETLRARVGGQPQPS